MNSPRKRIPIAEMQQKLRGFAEQAAKDPPRRRKEDEQRRASQTPAHKTKVCDPKARKDAILPAVQVTEASAVQRGRLLTSPLTEGRTIPLFAHVEHDVVTVPLLDLADSSGVRSTSRGCGAAFELRLAVEALLSLDLAEASARSVQVAWDPWDLVTAIKPNPAGRRRASRTRLSDWQRIHQALVDLDQRSFVPWVISSRTVQSWRVFAVRSMPPPDTKIPQDAKVVIEVALPPSAGPGPIIDREAIRRASVKSSPTFRAAIGVATLTWLPGRTRMPMEGIGGVWTGDPTRYPVLSARDRKYVAFSNAERSRSRADVNKAWEKADAAGIVKIIDRHAEQADGKQGWRIVLPRAATAIERAAAPANFFRRFCDPMIGQSGPPGPPIHPRHRPSA